MELKKLLLQNNPIAHKTWPIGQHLFRSKINNQWILGPASYNDALPETFDVESAIAKDDGGYFELPPVRPSYEEIAKALGGVK